MDLPTLEEASYRAKVESFAERARKPLHLVYRLIDSIHEQVKDDKSHTVSVLYLEVSTFRLMQEEEFIKLSA
jgi:hypothetical protein